MKGFTHTVTAGFFSAVMLWAGSLQADVWTLLPADQENAAGTVASGITDTVPARRQQVARLDAAALDHRLANTPLEALDGMTVDAPEVVLALPTPDGALERFVVVESPVMEPGLALWLTERGWPMRTFSARSLDRPGATARLDWGGPGGFHAVVQSSTGTYYVDPEIPGSYDRHVSYHKRDNRSDQPLQCEGQDIQDLPLKLDEPSRTDRDLGRGASTDGRLRTYRLAYAVAGNYTERFADGSVVTAQANVITIINRVNAIFERELSVRFIVIADNPDIVYADADTDPYDTSSASGMLSENQDNLDAVIGSANYDIGHVMYRGNSGIASLFTPCRSGRKARGVSGVWRATGDSIVVDMIAHELGHQFGAFHTFNSSIGNCSTSNRTSNSAWEPGSGTTIMSYSGICGADNIQSFSNDYFHAGSLDDMLDYVAGSGSCAATPSAGNPNAPEVSATGGHTLPIGTAFELDIDSASDADGDSLTFTWEQFDLGEAATLADGDQGDNPIVRSLPPGTATNRVVDGSRKGDTLPTTSRELNFRVTVRDNHPGGGRLGEANLTLNVDSGSGPFVVDYPNGGEDFSSLDAPVIRWDVAGTSGAPVNAATVDILLSTDGGDTYAEILAIGAPNDGMQRVNLPAVDTTQAKIKIRARDNVFFDVSDSVFSIRLESPPPPPPPTPGSMMFRSSFESGEDGS
jgi:hypothetical protein